MKSLQTARMKAMNRCKDRQVNRVAVVLAGIALVISLPLFAESIFEAPDTTYHLERISYLRDAMFNGDIQYRLQPGYYGGYGCPMGIYYGMLLMIPFAALHKLGVPLWQCYQGYIGFINILAVGIGYYCFRKIAGSRQAGVYGCIVYVTSYWFFQRAYLTAGIGEFSTFPFLPLLVLGFHELFTDDFDQSRKHLLAGYTMLLNTHLLTTVNASVIAFVFCAVKAKDLFKEKRWRSLLTTAVLTALANLWLLVPYVDFTLRYHFSLSDYVTDDLFGQSVPELIEKMGRGQILALFVCVLFLIKANDRKDLRVLLSYLGIAAVPLFLSTKYVPWGLIREYLPPVYAVTGEKIQAAFRYLTVAMPVISGACAYAAGSELRDRDPGYAWLRAVTVGVAFFSLITAIDLSVSIAVNAEGRKPIRAVDRMELFEGYRSGSDFFVYEDIDMDAFVSSGIDREIYASGSAVISDVVRNGTTFDLTVEQASAEETTLDFPVWYYYGYTARGRGTRMQVSDGPGHRVRVTLPAGYSGHCKVSFSGPWYWRVADIVSVLCIIFCLRPAFFARLLEQVTQRAGRLRASIDTDEKDQ